MLVVLVVLAVLAAADLVLAAPVLVLPDKGTTVVVETGQATHRLGVAVQAL
jgi:hypothetical protein